MKWLLIDLSCLAHRARLSLKDLTVDDLPTGVLYGFWEQVRTIAKRFESNKICMFCDSRTSFRTESFPDYKKKRKENRTPEDLESIKQMHDQVKLLRREILPAVGIHTYGQKGLESDDLLAAAADEITRRKEEGVIITSDRDLLQCISERVQWYDPQREILFDRSSMKQEKDAWPEQWGLVKAIGGCVTDSVPGVPGVGEITAVKYLNGQLSKTSKKYQAIEKEYIGGRWDLWSQLTILPHHKTKHVKPEEPQYNPLAFFQFCVKYNIDSYLDMQRANWDRFFTGEFNTFRRRRRRHGKR